MPNHSRRPAARRALPILLLAGVLAIVAAQPAGAQQGTGASPRHVTPELLLRDYARVAPPPASPAWLPGSEAIVLAAFESDDDGGAMWIQLIDVATGARRRLVRGTHPAPAPDGSAIAFIAGGEDGAQIHVMRLPDGEVATVTRVPGGLSALFEFAWAPDARHIAFSFRPTRPPRPARGEASTGEASTAVVVGAAGDTPPDTELWTADVTSGEARRLHAGSHRIVSMSWRPDGRGIVFSTYNYLEYRDDSSYGDVRLLSLATGESRILVDDRGVQLLRPGAAPRGELIAFTSFPENLPYPEFWDIAVVPAAGGTARILTRDLFVSSSPVWAPDAARIYFTAKLGAFNQIFTVTPAGELRQLTHAPRSASSPRPSPDGTHLLWLTRDALGRQSLRVGAADGSDERVLLEFAPAVDDLVVARTEAISWRSTDGLEIAGLLVWPLDHEPGLRYPLLVDVHGGPVGGVGLSGSILKTSPLEWQMWAARGFAVLVPDYRSSAIYGWAEIEGARQRQDANERDFDDIMAGVDHVIGLGLADPDRLALIGHSYGGYLTNWILTHTDRFRAAVSYEGYADNYLAYGTGFTTGGNRVFEWLFRGRPWEAPENYRRSSPTEFVAGVSTPTLFVSGGDGLPVFHNEFLYTAWRQQSVDAQLVIYRGEPHVIARPENQRDLLYRVLDWIEARTRQ